MSAPPLRPPPPRPSSSTMSANKAKPHQISESIPSLDSAPSSGNFAVSSSSHHQQQAASATAISMGELPPPPPPPPPRSGNSSASRATGTMASTASLVMPTSTLPPPPQVTLPKSTDVADPLPPHYLPFNTFSSGKLQILAQRHTHIPILVIATEQSQKLAWKNSLQLVDLFQGITEDITSLGNTTPFRSIYKNLYPDSVKVKFQEPTMFKPMGYQESHDFLFQNAKLLDEDGNIASELALLEDRVDELLQDHSREETIEQVTQDAYSLTSPLEIPWLLRYRQALDTSTDHLPHDLINCPPLVLLVCCSDEIAPPLEVLQELQNSPHVLPECFTSGLYDFNQAKQEFLVLHDAVDGPNNFGEQYLRQTLQNKFGPNAAVLRINSLSKEASLELSKQETTDLWGGNGQKGNYLSVNDRVVLRRYFQTLLTSSLLPVLEHRISELSAIVNERKKGVRNLVKSFWRKPKEDSSSDQTEQSLQASKDAIIKYRYDSIESQALLLADTLFLMEDYEASLSMYRLIREDYKSDKAMVHYAHVQEMMGLCMYFLDSFGRAREIFSHFETALLGYTRAAEEERAQWMGKDPSARPQAAPHATRSATRLCLIIATASEALTKGRELEVADLLASASSHESSMGAAVLLEQASAFYYHASMYRKYSFHMLMAGHMFRTALQDNHAFRCFTSALYVYRHGSWDELHNHLRSALAAQLYSMGRFSIALILYAKLVGTSNSKVSAKSQQKFLSHLLEICDKFPKKALAGSDRMAVPPNLIGITAREAFRNAQLERIVHVVRFTMGASRVLELPYMNLPKILDSTVKVWTHAEQHFVGSLSDTEKNQKDEREKFGAVSRGNDEVWKDLELMATSELYAFDPSSRPKTHLDELSTEALSKIQDEDHRKVIAQVDKEKANRALRERGNKKNARQHITERAKEEPIFCDFTIQNPLGVDIFMTEIQLVAKLTDDKNHSCTNQDAIQINSTSNFGSDTKRWNFASTKDTEFYAPDFGRFYYPDQKSCFPCDESPFFVVTKTDLQLAENGEATISVGLTPLVQGDLEIMGVRCKLVDKVWIYHPFSIQGPLLQDTRENIENRVRGESTLLKSKIELDMPCLTAELVKRVTNNSFNTIEADGGPLLEGQISPWTIRLRNVGNAPARATVLKTNVPWINVISSKEKNILITMQEQEAQATSHCLGPTGTLISLPVIGDHLKESGKIHPGESVDIAIQIRTVGHGTQEFYMLFRYELWDPMGNSPRRHRLLRQMYQVPVYPSLDLAAKIKNSFWKGNEQILSMELTNNRTDRPTDLFMTLDKLSVASRHYKLEALPGQFVTSEENGNVLQIGWQERVTLHYKIVPLTEESKNCLLSECAFSETAKFTIQECVISEATDFLCLEHARETFEASWKAHQFELARTKHDQGGGQQHPRSIASIRRANTSPVDPDVKGTVDDVKVLPTSIGKLCPPESSASKIHVICSWRAILGQEVIRGEHHLRGINVRPVSFFKGCPIVATAVHPPAISHDFNMGPASVRLRLTLRNQMLGSPVNFILSRQEHPSFELNGIDKMQMDLEAQEQVTISYDALIPTPGAHDLQAFKITLRRGEEELKFPLKQQWFVTVIDNSNDCL